MERRLGNEHKIQKELFVPPPPPRKYAPPSTTVFDLSISSIRPFKRTLTVTGTEHGQTG
jgi:hypothetical protein